MMLSPKKHNHPHLILPKVSALPNVYPKKRRSNSVDVGSSKLSDFHLLSLSSSPLPSPSDKPSSSRSSSSTSPRQKYNNSSKSSLSKSPQSISWPLNVNQSFFISYRRCWKEQHSKLIINYGSMFSRIIWTGLKAQGFQNVFLDVENLGGGQFSERIFEHISDSHVVITIVSPHSMERLHEVDDWVFKEWKYAIEQEKIIIPIFVDCNTLEEAGLQMDLLNDEHKDILTKFQKNNFIKFEWSYYEASLKKLVSFIESVCNEENI